MRQVFPLELAFNASAEEATLTPESKVRFFMTALDYSDSPQFDLKPEPAECDAANATKCAMKCNNPLGMCNRWVTAAEALANNASYLKSFSAVCFMTVRDIAAMHTGNRDVGLVFSAWGGTRVEAWMSDRAIAAASKAVAPPAVVLPKAEKAQNAASALYNAMAAPFNRMSIRASLWYQGEANCRPTWNATSAPGVDLTSYYAAYLEAMVADYRDRKGMGDFSFNPMSLPPSVNNVAPLDVATGRPEVRLAELELAPHPGGSTDITGVPVTVDLGGSSAWGYDHPPNKNEMSRRLALQTLHTAFGLQGRMPCGSNPKACIGPDRDAATVPDSLWTGPMLAGVSRGAAGVQLAFEAFSAEGLALRDVHARNINDSDNSCKRCCALAPPFEVLVGGRWARVARDKVQLGDATVTLQGAGAATAVRYAWSDYVDCVLTNSDDLPLAPFLQNVTADVTPEPAPEARAAASDVAITVPPMGFNSWNFYHCNIDEKVVMAVADAFASNGMAAVNYTFVNIDDCCERCAQREACGAAAA